MPSGDKLFGIVDTHVHFVNHLSSGGYMLWGKPHPANPATRGEAAEQECLTHCDGEGGHGPAGLSPSLEGTFPGHLVGGFPEFDGWPKFSTLAHQQAFIEWIHRAYQGGLRMAICLVGNSALVATRMAEIPGRGNKFGNESVDDMSAVRRQVAAMRALIAFVDAQEGGPGKGWIQIALSPDEAQAVVAADKLCMVIGVEVACLGNWTSPEHLESAASTAGSSPEMLIRAMVEGLHGLGVRHVFPLHGINNAFGGTALFVRNYDAANYLSVKQSFRVERADPSLGISYRIDEDIFTGGGVAEVLGYYGVAAATQVLAAAGVGLAVGSLVGGLVGGSVGGAVGVAVATGNLPCPPKPTNWNDASSDPALDTRSGGHINALGLTRHGKTLIEELIARRMMIDIDHMGEKTTAAVLDICERNQYPVVSGHASFRELRHHVASKTFRRGAGNLAQSIADMRDFGTLNARNLAREADKSPAQLERIRALGGYVSPILAHAEGAACACGDWTVPNDATGTSKSFAQAYLYAYAKMGGENVGLGSDINGAGTLPGPRFGPQASPALREPEDRAMLEAQGVTRRSQRLAQAAGVRYSGAMVEYRFSRFSEDTSTIAGAPFDLEERDFWQAIVMDQSNMRVQDAAWTGQGMTPFDGGRQSRISNFAAGLRARAGVNGLLFGFVPSPTFGVVGIMDLQYAAYCTTTAQQPVFPLDTPDAKRLIAKLAPVWTHWNAMVQGGQSPNDWLISKLGPRGSALYDAAGRLRRSFAGTGSRRRDFDINVDGMAHYGMLPDLLQDLHTVGLQRDPLEALYYSADAFINVWRRCQTPGLAAASAVVSMTALLL